jgi:uncharacterized protein YceH (UPF0502 family)
MDPSPLSPLETRVLGVLIEKQRSVPDTYPMSLNALVAGCNQKTSRSPIMNASEAEVLEALDALKHRSLVVETSGGRVMRYAHNAERALGLPSQSVALLATLALRGPQTAAELRSNSDRLHRFADVSAVEAFLHELAERPAGELVAELPRSPGTRETRWVHLLSGPPAPAAADTARSDVAAERSMDVELIATQLQALRDDVERLKVAVATLQGDRGMGAAE